MHACVARTNVLSCKRKCTYRPLLFFAYSPFNEDAVCERRASDDVSTIVNLGLAISGAQGDHGKANGVLNALNGTTNSTNSSVSQEDLPLHDAKYCEFLDRAGYAVGMLNIACFALIFVGLLLSPMRWWLYNRKVKKNRSDEFEQQEQEAMTRRRSSIQGFHDCAQIWHLHRSRRRKHRSADAVVRFTVRTPWRVTRPFVVVQ